MSSIFRKDKIGALTHNAGNISLGPSILTIGARQFETTANLVVALPSLTAFARYQIFTVNNAGTIQLVISQNENSQGPAGWSAWKLVGSLYADYQGNYGSFITIEGIPRTLTRVASGPLVFTAHTTPPTKGTINFDESFFERDGKWMDVRYRFNQLNDSGAAAGNGNYFLDIPGSSIYTIDNTLQQFDNSGAIGSGGTWNDEATVWGGFYSDLNDGSANGWIKAIPFDSTRLRFFMHNMNGAGNGAKGGWGSGLFPLTNLNGILQFQPKCRMPIEEWSETPIEDL